MKRFSRRVCLLMAAWPVLAVLSGAGCRQYYIDSADSLAERIIVQRQRQALGANSAFDIGPEDGRITREDDAYAFVPHPLDANVPEAFRTATGTQPTDTKADAGDGDAQRAEQPRPFTLSEALSYALRHARDFQTQKEDLYLSALALMTERQLWTPQVVGQLSLDYTNSGQIEHFDQAMTAVAELSATQNLPYGGQVAARVVNRLVRDISRRVNKIEVVDGRAAPTEQVATEAEGGQAILEATIPLLKGAGRVAYESRYQAERNLIYAVRNFEAARRDLVVDVAGDFFDLLATKTRIESAQAALASAEYDLTRSQAFVEVDKVLPVEADRSRVQVLDRRNDVISARTSYEAALDRFKIRIGMPTSEAIDAVDEDLALHEPAVTEADAVATALKYRLDLLNTRDAIDDSRRAVGIARNNFLPQFDLSGSVTMNTDSDRRDSFGYNTERTTWQGMLELELPLDRREERNSFRGALISLRRAQRDYDLAKDNVRLDVRDALRNLELARTSMEIQRESIRVNETREEVARNQFERGMLTSNRDVIEAQNALQSSKNQYAARQADYRLAILRFLRDTGTLRVDDDGHWVR